MSSRPSSTPATFRRPRNTSSIPPVSSIDDALERRDVGPGLDPHRADLALDPGPGAPAHVADRRRRAAATAVRRQRDARRVGHGVASWRRRRDEVLHLERHHRHVGVRELADRGRDLVARVVVQEPVPEAACTGGAGAARSPRSCRRRPRGPRPRARRGRRAGRGSRRARAGRARGRAGARRRPAPRRPGGRRRSARRAARRASACGRTGSPGRVLGRAGRRTRARRGGAGSARWPRPAASCSSWSASCSYCLFRRRSSDHEDRDDDDDHPRAVGELRDRDDDEHDEREHRADAVDDEAAPPARLLAA